MYNSIRNPLGKAAQKQLSQPVGTIHCKQISEEVQTWFQFSFPWHFHPSSTANNTMFFNSKVTDSRSCGYQYHPHGVTWGDKCASRQDPQNSTPPASLQHKVKLTALITTPSLLSSSVLTAFTQKTHLCVNTYNSLAQSAAPEALTPVKVQDWN